MSLARVETKKLVVTIEEDGAIAFKTKDGDDEGTLRLASVDPPSTWRLVRFGFSGLVLAMGEWLVWIDADSHKVARRVRAQAKVRELSVSGSDLVAKLEDGLSQTFDTKSGEPKVIPPVTAIAARGELVITGDKSGRVRVLSGDEEAATLAAGESVIGVHLTRRDMALAATARVLVRAGKPWTSPKPIALRGSATSFAADDAYAFTGTMTGGVEVYDLGSGRAVTSYQLTDDDRITALARLPGALLAIGTGALDGRVMFVDVAEAKVVHRLAPHQEAFGVTCLACDPRGRIVASGGDDGTVVLLDPVKGRVLATLRVRETPLALAFEATGRRLACAFADGTGAVIALEPRGAAIDDVPVRDVARVAWCGAQPAFGLRSGGVARGEARRAPRAGHGRARSAP